MPRWRSWGGSGNRRAEGTGTPPFDGNAGGLTFVDEDVAGDPGPGELLDTYFNFMDLPSSKPAVIHRPFKVYSYGSMTVYDISGANSCANTWLYIPADGWYVTYFWGWRTTFRGA